MAQLVDPVADGASYLAGAQRRMGALRPSVSWLVANLSAGVLAGIRTLIGATALAALIFSGELAGGLPIGIGILLFSAAAVGVVVGATSSYPGAVAQPQDGAAAILGLLALSVYAALPPALPYEQKLVSVFVAIGVTTFITGLFFLALGGLRLGGLVRFVPYPVVGGFLAGSGWLFVKGSLTVMIGSGWQEHGFSNLFEGTVAIRWLPGLVLAAALCLATRRSRHYLAPLGILAGSCALFYLGLAGASVSVEQARVAGWLLGPFPEGRVWEPAVMLRAPDADWGVLLGQLPTIATVVLVSVIALLLNATGLELATRREIELNRELRSAGLANLIAGAGGGLVGFQALSGSLLGHRMGASSRMIGVISGGLCLLGLVANASFLSYLPASLIGGVLLFIGIALLAEWLYDAYFRLAAVDYAMLVLIVLVIARFGYMEGVALGFVVAIIIFVVRYSRVSVIKQKLSGAEFHSNVERSEPLRELLREKGDEIHILKVGGFIFFGTANGILADVAARTEDRTRMPCRYVVLDFRSLEGVDCSAISTLLKMRDFCARRGIVLVFAQLDRRHCRGEFPRAGFDLEEDATFRMFADIDQAVEWCEDQIIQREMPTCPSEASSIRSMLRRQLASHLDVEAFLTFLCREVFAPGDYLIHQGERLTDMFFIESGRVRVALELADSTVRLRSIGPGGVVGEIAAYLEEVRSASVIAEEPTVSYRLSLVNLRNLEERGPAIAAEFHRSMAVLLSRRLVETNALLQKVL
jgi:SulP family sulfate permease